MAGISATKFNALDSLNFKSSLRKFTGTWEFLYSEAKAKSEAYRLIINLENNSFTVRREIPIFSNIADSRDVLKDFRLKSEVERLQKQDQEKLKGLKDELDESEQSEGGVLENLFYQKIFFDPNADVHLGLPLDRPSLAKDTFLGSGIIFRDIKVAGEKAAGPEVVLRFSANGTTDFAVVHLQADQVIYTAVINPATGKVTLYDRDLDFDWTIGKEKSN